MATVPTSYQYDTFEKQAQVEEFERLYHQASVMLDTERELWPTLGIVPGKKVLDLGCGSGIITYELAKQVYPTEVTGVDISKTLLETGQRLFSNERENNLNRQITFCEGSAYNIPFAANTFDLVYARLLFQHLSEPMGRIKEHSSGLKAWWALMHTRY